MKRRKLPSLRIPIREQLCLLLLLATAIGMAILAVASYVTTYRYVSQARQTRLSMSASLKASQLASNLALMENSAQFCASRIVVQSALGEYNTNGSDTTSAWDDAGTDMQAAISGPASGGAVGSNLLLQSMIFPASNDGPVGSASLLNTTNKAILGEIELPYLYPNGSHVYLGDEGLGYPPGIYPNFTYTKVHDDSTDTDVSAVEYDGLILSPLSSDSQALLLGPWPVNETYAILSITVPIVNNTSSTDVLGWLTIVMNARLVTEVIYNVQGLDQSGELLLIRPVNASNNYGPNVLYSDDPEPSVYDNTLVNFVLPLMPGDSIRHPNHVWGSSDEPFTMSSFPPIVSAVSVNNSMLNNAGADLDATNEEGQSVAVGYALVNDSYVDWVIIVEVTRSSAFASINALRRVILACLFGTLGGMLIIVWPLAHFASRPIRDLRSATLKTVMPQGYAASTDSYGDLSDNDESPSDGSIAAVARKEGFFAIMRRRKSRNKSDRAEDLRRQQFRIPSKVPDRKHVIRDELSELTKTFNEMTEELTMQYERLEERVQQRTAELELSKKAAEAANESKTLFIANISHELKTPLNGILGMCAVCMQEEDPLRLKRSLGIIYKSGDLLLNLLTDILTFSKNQVGQQLSLDEKEFHLRDVSSQILAIFEKQAREGQINLAVQFMRGDELDNQEIAGERVKDMVLWGDTHRILQVVINLVSNSLKFTPPQGSVTLNIKCIGPVADTGSRKTSTGSRDRKKNRRHNSDTSMANTRASSSGLSDGHTGGAFQRMLDVERSAPPAGKMLQFEFEVIDTGPGIPEDSQKKIFEPFVQGDLGLSKKYGGTGLGLSICTQLAGLMHGSMSVQSEVGVGSTFAMKIPLRHIFNRADSTASSNASRNGDVNSLYSSISYDELPSSPRKRSLDAPAVAPSAAPAPSASPIPDTSSKPRLVGLSQPFFASMDSPNPQAAAIEQIKTVASSAGKIRVLVAEDNKVNQEVVLRMLKLEDIYDVTVAKDGQEAFDLVKESMSEGGKGPFNLVFMDVQMPNLDGLQSTKLIRECGFDAPIVALTAFAEESNVKDCLDSGMNYFLSKPIRRPALKKVLNQYCSTIQEVDEDATTPPSPKATGKAAKSAPKAVQAATKSRPSTPPPPSSSPLKAMRRSVESLEMTAPGGTTVIVVSRPSSVDLGRRSGSRESGLREVFHDT